MRLADWIVVVCVAPFAWHLAAWTINVASSFLDSFALKVIHGKQRPGMLPRPVVTVDCHICTANAGEECPHLAQDVEEGGP